MRPMLVDAIPIDVGHHDLFSIDRSLCNDFAVRAANETLSPKLDSVAAGGRFMANAIRRGDIAAVRDRVTALDGFPGGMLRRAEFLLFRWMPADRRWIENDLRAAQRGEPRRFGIPLVPANADADFAVLRLPRLKSEIARREIKFLVIQRIVRNVHLAIFAEQFSVCVDDRRGIVINARAAFLEK